MAVGAQLARPDATVLAVCGDGGFVMSTHELDTIGAYGLPIKTLLFDDGALGMVSNQHEMYCGGRTLTSDRRRGRTRRPIALESVRARLRAQLDDAQVADDLARALGEGSAALAQDEWPLFAAQAAAYGIPAERVHTKGQFLAALARALATPGPYLLQIMLAGPHTVYPLIGAGASPQEIIWKETVAGSGQLIYARECFDYSTGRLRADQDRLGPLRYPEASAAATGGAPAQHGRRGGVR
jgi:acetolactate synthase-1/2/3 large subunit